MERPNTVAGLVEKRGQIAGEIELAQIKLRRLIADMDAVDTVLRMFAPELATETIKTRKPRGPAHQAMRGEVKRIVLDALREATGPVTTAHVAERVMAGRGLPASDPELRDLFGRRVGACLRKLELKGVTQQVDLPGRFNGWQIARR